MKKFGLLLLILIITIGIFANEKEDLIYIQGLYKDGHYDLAQEEMTAFLTNYPQSDVKQNVSFLLGQLLIKKENYKSALKTLEPLKTNEKNLRFYDRLLLSLSQAYYFNGNNKDSEKTALEFLKKYPDHKDIAEIHLILSKIYTAQEKFDKALLYCKKSLDYSESPEKYYYLIDIQLNLNKASDAEKSLQKMLIRYPGNELTANSVVNYLKKLVENKKYETASEIKSDIIPQKSEHYTSFIELLVIANFEMGNYDRVLELCRTTTENTDLLEYYKALTYLNIKEFELATSSFEKTQQSENVDISSGSIFYLAKINISGKPEKAKNLLKTFISENPDHAYIAEANFLLGLLNYEYRDFKKAIESFEIAKKKGLKHEQNEQADFILAEIDFLNNDLDSSLLKFDQLLEDYKQGNYVDESLFKKGLIYLQKNNFPDALIAFESLINHHLTSRRVPMAYIYIGDIYAKSQQYDIARNKYLKSLEFGGNEGIVNAKLAQNYLDENDVNSAHKAIENIPSNKEFNYIKSILLGNAYFAQKNYSSALASYKKALTYAETENEKFNSKKKLATIYYQIKDYENAQKIYQELAISGDQSEMFLYEAAVASFNAEDYQNSIKNFENYVKKFPEGAKFNNAVIGIADSYYNLSKYSTAFRNYLKVLDLDIDFEVRENALNGLQWSAEMDSNLTYITVLDKLVDNADAETKPFYTLKKMEYFYKNSQWEKVIELYPELVAADSTANDKISVNLWLAEAKFRRDDLNGAERILRDFELRHPVPELYYNWGILKLSQGDTLSALSKLKKGAYKSEDSEIWKHLLRLELDTDDPDFLSDCETFISRTNEYNQLQTNLLKIEYYINKNKFDEALSLIDEIPDNSENLIKAKTQYFKGLIEYNSGDYKTAVRSLLRIRYNYPKLDKIKIEAEEIACYAYLKQGERDKAKSLFDSIKEYMSPERKEKLLIEINKGAGR